MQHKPHVAFFGLGTMGTGMAHRILGAGYSVTVYNRTAERAGPLVRDGAHVAATAREAAAGAGVLISMLADDPASRAVWLGENGALAGAGRDAVAIECSTVTVPWVMELAQAAAEKSLAFLDAPVTGTKPHAARGELVFLVGGEAAVLERVRPILAAMSKEIVHVGPAGSGAALKLINNFMCGVQAVALAEASAMLQREGLNLTTALPVLLNGAPGSPVARILAERHGKKDYTPNFQLRLLAKDLSYAIGEAGRRGIDLGTAKAALVTLNAAAAAGLGEQDMSAVLKFVEERGK